MIHCVLYFDFAHLAKAAIFQISVCRKAAALLNQSYGVTYSRNTEDYRHCSIRFASRTVRENGASNSLLVYDIFFKKKTGPAIY